MLSLRRREQPFAVSFDYSVSLEARLVYSESRIVAGNEGPIKQSHHCVPPLLTVALVIRHSSGDTGII